LPVRAGVESAFGEVDADEHSHHASCEGAGEGGGVEDPPVTHRIAQSASDPRGAPRRSRVAASRGELGAQAGESALVDQLSLLGEIFACGCLAARVVYGEVRGERDVHGDSPM